MQSKATCFFLREGTTYTKKEGEKTGQKDAFTPSDSVTYCVCVSLFLCEPVLELY